jgi:hypothetical protein
MRWVRSLLGLLFVGFWVAVVPPACRSTAETAPAETRRHGQVTDGGSDTPLQGVRRWDAGMEPREGPPPFPAAADAGACPGRQERCCDGHCGTALECAQLACDPVPQRRPAAEER